jgi:hypothetical protein
LAAARDGANTAPCPPRTGTDPGPNGTNDRPVASSGNVTYFNCRAVGFNDLLAAPMIPVKAILITFE